MLQEPVLDIELKENMQALLKMDELKSMLPRDVHGFLNQSKSCKSSTELVYLQQCQYKLSRHSRQQDGTYPVYQRPVPSLNQERELLQQPAQEVVLESPRVRRHDLLPVSQYPYLSFPPARFLWREEGGRSGAMVVEQRCARPWAGATGFNGIWGGRAWRLYSGSAAVKYAIPGVPVDPCATKEQCHHDEWLDEGSNAHSYLDGER